MAWDAKGSLRDSGRPLAARLAEAIALEQAAQEALVEAAALRAELEAERAAQVQARSSELYVVPDGELAGSHVRDAVLRFPGGFTISELAAEVDATPKVVKKFLEPMLLSGMVKDSGQKFAGKAIFEYVPVERAVPLARERRPPPEVTTRPAGELSMATGEPVRVKAMDKLTRKARSQSGVHKHRMRDRNYERMQAKREERGQGAAKKESVQQANARAAMEVNMKDLRKKASKNRGTKK